MTRRLVCVTINTACRHTGSRSFSPRVPSTAAFYTFYAVLVIIPRFNVPLPATRTVYAGAGTGHSAACALYHLLPLAPNRTRNTCHLRDVSRLCMTRIVTLTYLRRHGILFNERGTRSRIACAITDARTRAARNRFNACYSVLFFSSRAPFTAYDDTGTPRALRHNITVCRTDAPPPAHPCARWNNVADGCRVLTVAADALA